MTIVSKLFGITLLSAMVGPTGGYGESIRLSRPLPVVNQPLTFSVQTSDSPKELVIKEVRTGKVVFEGKPVPSPDGWSSVEFTPPRTGYYLALEKGAAESADALRFPVVYRDMTFLAWPPLKPDEKHLRCLSTHVVVTNTSKAENMVELWRKNGSKILINSSAGSRQVNLEKGFEENVEFLLRSWAKAADADGDGIYIDEFGSYADKAGHQKTEIIVEALKRYRTRYPDKLLFTAIAGSPLEELCAGLKNSGATALLEVYESWLAASFGTQRFYNYLDRRIEIARHTDLLSERGQPQRAVIYVGADGLHGGTTPAELEDTVQYIKKQAPEMPGIAFYASAKTYDWMRENDLRTFMEDLCIRYYVAPVLEVGGILLSSERLTSGDRAEVSVRVNNLGGMDASNVKVTLFATPVGHGKRIEIGSTNIAEIGCGFDMVSNPNLGRTEYEIARVGERDVPVFSSKSYVWKDRATVRFQWAPTEGGAYMLSAVIQAGEDVTILDGVANRNVVIH